MKLAVVLLAYGGPAGLGDVEPFLRRVIAPREPTAELLERTCSRYQAIGGGSPLVANTLAQARALQGELEGGHAERLAQAAGGPVQARVFVGMRSSAPLLDTVLPEALSWGDGRALGLVMASHQSRVATGGYAEAVARVLPGGEEAVRLLPPWHLAPGYLDAVADRIREALARLDPDPRDRAPLLFTAHSLPFRDGEEDVAYEVALKGTIGGVAERLGERPWRLGYQSRSSRPGVSWLGPDTGDVLREMAVAGHRAVAVVPLGFVAEHLETLYDLDLELAGRAGELGIAMARAATVQDHPAFIGTLAQAVVAAVPTLPQEQGR